MSEYFTDPKCSGGRVEVELDLSLSKSRFKNCNNC